MTCGATTYPLQAYLVQQLDRAGLSKGDRQWKAGNALLVDRDCTQMTVSSVFYIAPSYSC